MRSLILVPDPRLTVECDLIPSEQFANGFVAELVSDLQNVLYTRDDGVAIAAPQVGETAQLFIISGRAFLGRDAANDDARKHDMVFVNPRITKASKNMTLFKDEGCLSIPDTLGDVERHDAVVVVAQNIKGEKFKLEAEDFIGQICQHEIDHLHGVLFTDRATNIRVVTEEEHRKGKND